MLKKIGLGLAGLLIFAYIGLAYVLPWAINKPPAALTPSPNVQLTSGIASGGWVDETQTIAVYNGLPYAAPPIGPKRWKPPADPFAWTGVRDARAFGNECLQYREGIQQFIKQFIAGHGLPAWKQWLAARVVAGAPAPQESEDCLYLNVRTDNVKASTLKPVMVWFHGGSHMTGAGHDVFYQANGLVEKGVVLVTINYRLGPFGYLAHPSLSADDPNNSSGNYGLLDQIKSLEWVQKNISVFGGDPGNVTIFGESAGAQSVSEVMASPLGDGLYHKAILQSGSSTYNRIHLKAPVEHTKSAEAVGEAFLRPLLHHDALRAGAAELRNLPAEAILAQIPEMPQAAPYFLPNVDGWVLPQMIGERIQDGSALRVPILAGYNADEGTLFYDEALGKPTVLTPGPFPAAHEDRLSLLEEIYGTENANALRALYKLGEEKSWDKGATDMLGDDIFGVHMRYLGRANANKGLPTWLYFFTRTPASPKQTLGAFHASELAFVFDSHNTFLEANAADFALTDAMGSYWTNFAKTGNPNGPGVPQWPAYQSANDEWMHLSHTIEPWTGVRVAKLDIMTQTLEKKLADSIDISKRVRPSLRPSPEATGLPLQEISADTFEP